MIVGNSFGSNYYKWNVKITNYGRFNKKKNIDCHSFQEKKAKHDKTKIGIKAASYKHICGCDHCVSQWINRPFRIVIKHLSQENKND